MEEKQYRYLYLLIVVLIVLVVGFACSESGTTGSHPNTQTIESFAQELQASTPEISPDSIYLSNGLSDGDPVSDAISAEEGEDLYAQEFKKYFVEVVAFLIKSY